MESGDRAAMRERFERMRDLRDHLEERQKVFDESLEELLDKDQWKRWKDWRKERREEAEREMRERMPQRGAGGEFRRDAGGDTGGRR